MNFLIFIVNIPKLLGSTASRLPFCYNVAVRKGKKPKMPERPVFDSIRKPTAPPTRKLGTDKPEEKIHPAGRGSKYKKKTESEE